MNWASLTRQLLRLSLELMVGVALYALLRLSGLHARLAPDAEGLSTLISLIGSIYAVMFAFVIFVIWGQFTEVENVTFRECSALNDLLRFCPYLNPDAARIVRRAISDYTQRVINSEWRSLGERRRDPPAEKAFQLVVNSVLRIAPANPSEEAVVERLIDIMRKTAEQRDERISKSLTRIPPTLLALVRVMACALLVLVFVYPFHSSALGLCCFAGLGAILFLSNLVMTDTDNPFDGIFNVSSAPFRELML